MGLLSSSIDLVGKFTQFGLRSSSVRNIAEADATKDTSKIAIVIGVLRRLVWITGMFGVFVCFFAAPTLSNYAFKNSDYVNAFRLLSISLFFDQISQGQSALLQGLRQYKYLVRSSAIGITLGLMVSIPMFYLWNLKAIVPVMIISSAISLVLTYYFSHKVKVDKIRITTEHVRSEGFNMISMGFLMTVKSILLTITSYIMNIFISRFGTIKDVGFYGAGFGLVNMSVNMIFSAMGAEYYPRLSSYAADRDEFSKAINQQAEITLLLIAPIVAAVIIFVIPVIIILYSEKFIPAETMIYWAMFATLFKGYSWAVGFSILAKGDRKIYFWSETIAVTYMFLLNITFYYYWGLTGIGISFLVSYALLSIQVWVIASRRYSFAIKKSALRILITLTILCGICLAISMTLDSTARYTVGILVVGITFLYSYRELDKRVDILKILKSKVSKFRK